MTHDALGALAVALPELWQHAQGALRARARPPARAPVRPRKKWQRARVAELLRLHSADGCGAPEGLRRMQALSPFPLVSPPARPRASSPLRPS